MKEGSVLPGIKVDKGAVELAGTNGDTTTKGHDDLGKHCAKYYEAGIPEGACCYKALNGHHILLEGSLPTPNMVTPRLDAAKVAPEVVVEYTVRTLLRTVPAAVPVSVFLSGGQSEEEGTLNLDAMICKEEAMVAFFLLWPSSAAEHIEDIGWEGENMEKARLLSSQGARLTERRHSVRTREMLPKEKVSQRALM
ncbi:fructose-bisphosphate aldolase, cytoplasmic [Musa troglodytarum]|uniref:fructose-bisphosphate aldolase n=1 Tax=Musa troglodytarum TaxID=320322 RepID=A0A9E7EPZ3_9LILI|nr:fructose-bisphosphate aldolase, cytoplasmic [Musa troglodytarum]